MPTIKKVIAGKKAKYSGIRFEEFLKSCAYKQKWEVIQIPSGCRSLGRNKLIRVATPFDFVFAKQGKCLFIDAKSTTAKSFSKSMITPHQALSLSMVEKQGFYAGYIVNFSNLNKIVFFSARHLLETRINESLCYKQGVIIGDSKRIDLDMFFVT